MLLKAVIENQFLAVISRLVEEEIKTGKSCNFE